MCGTPQAAVRGKQQSPSDALCAHALAKDGKYIRVFIAFVLVFCSKKQNTPVPSLAALHGLFSRQQPFSRPPCTHFKTPALVICLKL